MPTSRRLRWLLLLLLIAAPGFLGAQTLPTALPIGGLTRAEAEANQYARAELAAAPPHGNLPDDSLPPDTLRTAQRLEHTEVTLGLAGGVWTLLQLPLLLVTGLAARMQAIAERGGRALRARGRRVSAHLLEALVFSTILSVVLAVADLPLRLLGHHLGLAYGLSVQRWPAWFGDLAKSLGVGIVATALLLALLVAVVRSSPRRWWLWFWACCAPLLLFSLWIEPVLIEPLFNHFTPLAQSNPALTARLQQVARHAGLRIPADHMFLMQASAKTPQLNAYVTGFGSSKRLVLWDTTVRKLTPDQLLVVFGHEAGHYVLGHVLLGLCGGFLSLGLILYLGYRATNALIRCFGPRCGIASQGDWAAVIVLMFVADLLGTAAAPVGNTISRQAEHAADIFGQEVVHGLVADPREAARSSFQTLGESSLDVPNPNLLLEFWTGTHPALGRRAAFAHAYDPWRPGYAPKYMR